ncbi:hypothetical protein QSI_3859 [Clostridioides difficile P28]|nr:hypothetical protein QSI_3859 [Clostridioides difficile P28]
MIPIPFLHHLCLHTACFYLMEGCITEHCLDVQSAILHHTDDSLDCIA